MDYQHAKSAVIALLDESHNARAEAANLRSVLAHAAVEIALHQEGSLENEKRRSEMFDLHEKGWLRLSIGGGRCLAEIGMPNVTVSQPRSGQQGLAPTAGYAQFCL